MPQSRQQRARAVSRARTARPRKRGPTNRQRAARRRILILGIVVAAALLITLVFSSNGNGPPTTANTQPSASDPNQLIAAATAHPTDGDTVGNLADYYDKTGQYQQALALYQRYLLLRPDDARARVSVGELLLVSGDVQGAQSQFVQAIALKPIDQALARAHLGLGNAYTSLQPPRLNDALNEYRQASDLDPAGDIGDDARRRLAGLQQQLGQPTVAVIAPSVAPSAVRPTGTP